MPILFRILTYDRTLYQEDTERLRIGLLCHPDDEASQKNMDAMVSSLTDMSDKTINGVPFEFVILSWHREERIDEIIRQAGIHILYVTEGHLGQLPGIRTLSRELKMLTLSANSNYVTQGLSLGLELDENRPRILVNLKALEAEGHDLEARVLRLCKVVEGP